MAFSLVKDCYILRISYVYVTYMLCISYVIDKGKIKVSPYFHIKKCVDTTNMGGRTYPVRYYPVAIRLRDRKGRAILCIALFPQSGDSSGAILGVRSVALLHVIDSGKKGKIQRESKKMAKTWQGKGKEQEEEKERQESEEMRK